MQKLGLSVSGESPNYSVPDLQLSQVTCGDHVKWITDEKSRKDRSVSKGETMSKENGRDLKEES